MSLLKKAQRSIIPIRSQIDLLSAQHSDGLSIDNLRLPSGLIVNRVEELVDLEAHFIGLVGGVATKETTRMTFYDYAKNDELPIIKSVWEKGRQGSFKLGSLGPVIFLGVNGKNEVGLKRFPDYANHFLDLLIAGRTLQ